ncbi:MAG TPA: UDP-N-acetylmuramoyl-L-alanyl-D-glutamate--2,6-diaminopimelate ligase [Candidatus Akkermansia intestinavium]|nr:UDP-N-acetylmuramoyl-L-alanyl-D-glutamate--2,6-diaminopimelate ligase [Candidatus Akkermansia intestinavium]
MYNKQLFSVLPDATITGKLRKPLSLLTDDSRAVIPGACFIAVKGSTFDGHSAIPAAIAAGAQAIVAETPCPAELQDKNLLWVQVSDSHLANGLLMSAWYGFPSRELVVLGVTGTNGKTTISYLCNAIFRSTWQRAGLIGTIKYDDGATRRNSHNTTPGAAELQSMLADMVRNGCRACAIEVSSHALVQKRTAGTDFRVGIFTNLTQDHLDFHRTMEDYYQAKKLLFTGMAASGDRKATAVINIDDAYGQRLAEELRPIMRVRTFGQNAEADFHIVPKLLSLKGSHYELIYQGRSYLVRTPLIGAFNMSNSLAALAGAVSAGVSIRDAISCLAQSPQVPGRLELVASENNVRSFVDYAHTPDAIENVCRTMRELCNSGRLITVFGCGGDRDRTKRPLMGAAAARYSDLCLVTSDNPRSEDPDAIIDEIMPGIPRAKQHRILDRAEAIRTALDLAKPGDVVLIAGKGHENYQIFADATIHFSDAEVVQAYYREKNPEGRSIPSARLAPERRRRRDDDASADDSRDYNHDYNREDRLGNREDRPARSGRGSRFDRRPASDSAPRGPRSPRGEQRGKRPSADSL